jgi:hypothetical protein
MDGVGLQVFGHGHALLPHRLDKHACGFGCCCVWVLDSNRACGWPQQIKKRLEENLALANDDLTKMQAGFETMLMKQKMPNGSEWTADALKEKHLT